MNCFLEISEYIFVEEDSEFWNFWIGNDVFDFVINFLGLFFKRVNMVYIFFLIGLNFEFGLLLIDGN